MRKHLTLADTLRTPSITSFVVRGVVFASMAWAAFDFGSSILDYSESPLGAKYHGKVRDSARVPDIVFGCYAIAFVLGGLAAIHIGSIILAMLGLRIRRPTKRERKQQRENDKRHRNY